MEANDQRLVSQRGQEYGRGGIEPARAPTHAYPQAPESTQEQQLRETVDRLSQVLDRQHEFVDRALNRPQPLSQRDNQTHPTVSGFPSLIAELNRLCDELVGVNDTLRTIA